MKTRSLRLLLLLIFFCNFGMAQDRSIWLDKADEECAKGRALLHIEGLGTADSLSVEWSTGVWTQKLLRDLDAGDYWVRVYLSSRDSLKQSRDTTIYFTVEKLICPVQVGKYFSPNGDGYNDYFMIGRIEQHPEFELIIYNKVGQRVHHQQKTYEPWDGKWLGTELPDGTYYFILWYNKADKNNFFKGDITILR